MAQEIERTEVRTRVTTEGAVRTFTAETEDGIQLVVTNHADGTTTVRIGRGGQGPKVRISEEASGQLAAIL
ncbi:hypothetical protein [Bifidobacterium jacchi]|uniref:Uncharacterized protein n=1 Tax=Bifidobacterium jacchi TaxID=2490545 RepID=A0A5N5RN46_9BIFI|nr:hypothetical protein [Bifidobacterium jacchi]KAB5608380.1 hypothetical protein EHS19_01795 [Bifidobacterium jacchi]